MNPLAQELNARLESGLISGLLSNLGKRLYFPNGIVAQAGEAAHHAHRFNATAGVACTGGKPMLLKAIGALAPTLSPGEFVAYAPTLGDEALRTLWDSELERKNPSLKGVSRSRPAVVPGLTAGISLAADLFIDEGDRVILPELSWDNYRLIFEDRRGASLLSFPLFDAEGRFNISAFRNAVRSVPMGSKAVLMFNFPNNPTGYSPTLEEAELLLAAVRDAGDSGRRVLAICDDAYFGLTYERGLCRESLFGRLACLHENVFAVKVDGPTKEDFVWGLRIGFLSFGSKALTPDHYGALEEKLKGAVRSSFSSSSRTAQSMLLRAVAAPGYSDEKIEKLRLLSERYEEVRRAVSRLRTDSPLTALPFNSGYFMTFRLERGDAEQLRRTLLAEEGIGTVSIDSRHLRVAWAAVDTEKIQPLFDRIAAAAARPGACGR